MKATDMLSVPGRGFPRLVGDAEGLFMYCHRVTADYLAQRLGRVRVLEICCGVGALTAALSQEAECVFAVDADPIRIKCASINVQTYGNPERVTFRETNALSEAVWVEAQPDVVVADPDWAERGSAKSDHTSDLALTQPSVPKILDMVRRLGIRGVVIRLASVSDLSQLAAWGPFEAEKVFVDGSEKYWLIYFGTVIKTPGITTELRLFNS
jgi:hypothetical protein